jgi:hypothetical protein
VTPGVGIVLNPRAGRDIRRLVAHAPMASGPDKLLKVRRIIEGVRAYGPLPVLMVEDEEGLAQRTALDVPEVELLGGARGYLGPEATQDAVRRLVDRGARVLVVIGGDGTQRQVALARPEVPILPVAGGTNNVACWIGEDTVAGMAAARVVRDGAPDAPPGKILMVETESGVTDAAVVDVGFVATAFVGALAVWDPLAVERVVMGAADPVRPGLSNVGGHIHPLSFADDAILEVEMGLGGREVPTVLAPGLVAAFRVVRRFVHALGEAVDASLEEGFTVALDGERTIACRGGERVRVTGRRTGPRWIMPTDVLGSKGFPDVAT